MSPLLCRRLPHTKRSCNHWFIPYCFWIYIFILCVFVILFFVSSFCPSIFLFILLRFVDCYCCLLSRLFVLLLSRSTILYYLTSFVRSRSFSWVLLFSFFFTLSLFLVNIYFLYFCLYPLTLNFVVSSLHRFMETVWHSKKTNNSKHYGDSDEWF